VGWGAGLCIVLAIATESAAWFIGSAFVLVLVLIVLKRAFYYVTLGRTTATEVPGTGFLDLDELRNEFTGLEANDPKLYQELVAPYLDSWKTQFGRRVPLQAYEAFRKRIDNEINAIQEKKQKLIDDAAKKGATLDIAALRKSMEKSKSEYKGADRQDYAREIDAWLIRLEAKYGASIPVDEASRILDELEAGMREKERQPPSSLRKEIGKHSAIALWFQQRANSQQSATSLTYREFVQWFLGLKLVGDAEVQLQVFADGIRSYYQDITQTLGKDCLNAFSPTDNIPNEAKAMLAESKGLTWVKMAESALTKMWDLENDFQRRADPTALELIRLLLHANDLMDIGTFLRAEDRVIELRGVCYALIRESEKANDAELAQGVVTYCALRNALRASPGLRQYIGL